MKKIVLLVAFCLGIGSAFAQDIEKLKADGDAALNAKNYTEALAKYGEYLKLTEYKDTVRIFNCGFCANQAKNYAEAAKYFDMAVKFNYNLDDSYTGEAMAYRNLNKTEEFFDTVEAGLKALPGNTNLEKMLYAYGIKQGQAAQKKGDLETATRMYKAVLNSSNKKHQEGAYQSLGGMLYNVGATKLNEIYPLATSDPDKYQTEKAKADAQLKEAKGYLDKALELNPNNANAKKLVDAIAATLK